MRGTGESGRRYARRNVRRKGCRAGPRRPACNRARLRPAPARSGYARRPRSSLGLRRRAPRGSPCAVRVKLSAPIRSGAVSTSVPSRSKTMVSMMFGLAGGGGWRKHTGQKGLFAFQLILPYTAAHGRRGTKARRRRPGVGLRAGRHAAWARHRFDRQAFCGAARRARARWPRYRGGSDFGSNAHAGGRGWHCADNPR